VELQMSLLQGAKIHRPRSRHAEVDDWDEEPLDLSKWGHPHDGKPPKMKLDADDQKIGYLVEQTVQVQSSKTSSLEDAASWSHFQLHLPCLLGGLTKR
jgi:hypothetical protein